MDDADSIVDFFKTGTIGTVAVGSAADALTDSFGEPEGWGVSGKHARPTFWRYGDIEFGLSDDNGVGKIHYILIEHFTGKKVFNSRIAFNFMNMIHDMKITDFLDFLDRNGVEYQDTTNDFRRSQDETYITIEGDRFAIFWRGNPGQEMILNCMGAPAGW